MYKKLTLLSLLICLLSFSYAEKYALIVAIGDYPEPDKNGWGKISSANDVPLVKTALQNQGFKTENITILQDAAATKDGIIKAFDKLIATVNKGDIVVIHFSSHGEQIEDNNGDELDRLDETIVPYGAVYTTDKSKYKEYADGYFRDDDFGDKVTLLRNKLTGEGDLLVLLDACHSGTGTRGVNEAKPRGALPPMVSDQFKMSDMADKTDVFKDNNGAKLSNDAATYVVISGAQAKEFNYECFDDNGNPVGSLSYAFSKTVSQIKDSTISYRGIFAQIEDIMRDKAPRQKPVLEGDGVDRSLFGGDFITQQPYFTVKRWNSNKELVLKAGAVTGITKGSVVNLYPSGTADPAKVTAKNKGTVVSVTNYDAVVKLEKEDSVGSAPWIFMTEMNYGNKLKVDVRDVYGVKKKLQTALKDFNLIEPEFTKACEVFIDTIAKGQLWAVKYATTGLVFDTIFKIDDTTEIKSTLKRFTRYRYLQGMKYNEDGLQAKVELVFLKPNGEIDYEKINSRTLNGRLELKEGDEVFLKIINTGEKLFYINIVDIQPNGIINPVLPYKQQQIRAEDCRFYRNDSLILKSYTIGIGPPFGEETFKIFLAKDEIDLEDILTSPRGGGRTRGAMKSLEQTFSDADGDAIATRGVGGKVNTDQNGTIFNLNFNIVPAK
ncbi:MAG: caspase family protein [Chitinophagales bacterium]|nr:caspase family protein [Chitinophagales bacterium]